MYSRSLDNSRTLNNDPKVIREYFRVLKQAIQEFKIKPHNIYNMDEKGFLLGLIQRSVRVLVKATEKTAFLRQPGQRETITVMVSLELFMQLFQEARKEVFTNRLCRSAFRSTGIHPDAVLKNIPELKTTENRIGTPPAPDGSTPMTPSKRTTQEVPLPSTPHNAIGVKEHAAVVLQEFDSLACQGVDIESGVRERVQQLAKSAHMSMAREAIQIETNRQLRRLNRTKGNPDNSSTRHAGSRTQLTDKRCRVLTIEEARLRKRRVEEKNRGGGLEATAFGREAARKSLRASDD